jgi:tetratricopeptide (TPR) repeat protein
MDLQQWDKAEQALRRALEINQKTANAYFALGETYSRQQKYAEAEKALRAGLAVEDRSYQGHFALARVYWDEAAALKDEAQVRGALERAYQETGRAIELNPNLAGAHLLRGKLLLRVPRAQEALAEFQEYLRLEPKGKTAEQTRALVERIKKALAEQKKPANK